MKVLTIRSFHKFRAVATKTQLSYADDRAVAEFRGFLEMSGALIKSVNHPLAIDTMLEIVESIKNDLLTRKSVVD